jgi:hypothetical protein
VHFVNLMLAQTGPLSDRDKAALAAVIQHMKADPEGAKVADSIECEVGTRTSNLAQLRECTAALEARAPDDPQTITYKWALAIQEGKLGEADALIARAKGHGLRVDEMIQTTEGKRRQRLRLLLAVLAILTALAGAVVAARGRLRRVPAPTVG